jgi:hypothetical protein
MHKPAPPADAPTPAPDNWAIDTSFFRYSEAERITVLEPQVAVRRNFAENRSLDILVTVDTISGATPLGTLPATAATAPSTVTGPSGRSTNPTVGKIPLSHMTDTRYALDTTWQQPVADNTTGAIGANASKETDYLSVGAHTQLARDFNHKDTTLSLGVSPEYDISKPNGGLPMPFATENAAGAIDGTHSSKWLFSGLAGITQVVNRRMLMQLNYTLTKEHGYLNDPYKLLSLVDTAGNPTSAIYESRPHQRTAHSVYWLTKYNIWGRDIASFGLRLYSDDWGIRSHTLDFTFHRQSSDRVYWEPHVRYYHQTAADFYHVGLANAQPLPAFASPDLRLADFKGVTFGVRWGFTLKNGSLLVLRAEYYTQTGNNYPQEAIGAQRSFDLFPTLYATLLQIDYHFNPATLFGGKGGAR